MNGFVSAHLNVIVWRNFIVLALFNIFFGTEILSHNEYAKEFICSSLVFEVIFAKEIYTSPKYVKAVNERQLIKLLMIGVCGW